MGHYKEKIMWKRFDEAKPEILRYVLVVSEDGRMWVGCRCDFEKCNEIHYQSDGYEASYIPSPVMWQDLPDNPLSASAT